VRPALVVPTSQQELRIVGEARWRSLADRQLVSARIVAESLTYEACANELDAVFGAEGRPVSASLLRNALTRTNGNHARLEWGPWFAARSAEIQGVYDDAAGRLSELTPEEELDLLRETVRGEFGRQGAQLVAKVRATRRRR
jgi:hypothetical protein